jgi:hypothetical protein
MKQIPSITVDNDDLCIRSYWPAAPIQHGLVVASVSDDVVMSMGYK